VTASAYAAATSSVCTAWTRNPAGSGRTGISSGRTSGDGSSGPANSRRMPEAACRLKMSAGRSRTTRNAGWAASTASSARSAATLWRA
jgi:hypothetical protein